MLKKSKRMDLVIMALMMAMALGGAWFTGAGTLDQKSIYTLILSGLTAGLLSGFVGIGGGIVMVPMMVFMLGMTQLQAQGTSLAVLMMPIGALAVFNYYKAGHVDFKYAFVIAAFFILGSYLGSKFAIKMDHTLIKRVFGVFMLIMAIKFISGK